MRQPHSAALAGRRRQMIIDGQSQPTTRRETPLTVQTTRQFGSQSMAGRLRRVLMRSAASAMRGADAGRWHYGPGFDPQKAALQHAAFADQVAATGAEIVWLTDEEDGLADSVFTHDPSLMTDHGALILSMGKALRLPEPALHEAAYARLGIPILGRVELPGTVEGGDCVWVDATTLAIGRGVRTNQDGIQQVAKSARAKGHLGLRLRPAAVAWRGGLPASDVGDQPAGGRSRARLFAAAARRLLPDAEGARHPSRRGRRGRIPRLLSASA